MQTLFGGVGLGGMPTPSPEIVRRLKEIDSHLGIRWNHALKCWGLTWEWKETDPRREMVQRQEMHPDDAYDLLAMAPAEMLLDEAFALLSRNIRQNTSEYAKELVEKVRRHNAGVAAAATQPLLDQAFNEVEVMGGKLFAKEVGVVPKVYNAGIPAPLKPVKTKAKKQASTTE